MQCGPFLVTSERGTQFTAGMLYALACARVGSQ